MIHPTPQLHSEAKALLNNGNWDSEPLKKRFKGFDAVFVSLHPFMKVKPEYMGTMEFKPGSWPSTNEINERCESVQWTTVIQDSDFRDIAELDRGLAAMHCARMFSPEGEHGKLNRYLSKHNDIIPAQVDYLPEIQEKVILDSLKSLGVENVFVYSDVDEKPKEPTSIDDWNTGFANIPSHVRIESEDGTFLLVEDFDQRYTYLVGARPIIEEMIRMANLEGFYCDVETPAFWSFQGKPKPKTISGEFQKAVNWITKKNTHNKA